MKRFVIEQSDDEFYTSHSGISLVGLALNRFTSLASALAGSDSPNDSISTLDILRSYCVLLAQGKSDFAAIEQYRDDDFFREAIGAESIPSEATLRQRLDAYATGLRAIVSQASIDFLKKSAAPLGVLSTGHIPLDIDGYVLDNSGSKKEKVQCTYRQVDGYLALPAYLGTEGWLVNEHLLPGSQHPQKEFVDFIQETIDRIRQFCQKKLLLRADSAHDALDNLAELSRHKKLDYLIKWNPRKQNKETWLQRVHREGRVTYPRPGKCVGTMSIKQKQRVTDPDGTERTFTVRQVIRVTERSIKDGVALLIPDIELEGWFTSLTIPDEDIIALYKGHALCEQYHAEIKTDMDLERLPSGKFATNQLIMTCGALVYNILRFIGQTALVNAKGIIRHEAKRRRIKTVMQELIYFAARLISSGRRLKLRFSRHVTAHVEAFRLIYQRLAYG